MEHVALLVLVCFLPEFVTPATFSLLLQTVDVTASGTDLLSTAYRSRSGTTDLIWVGASSSTQWGWSWVDGTPATNLACNTVGCGPWRSSSPTSSGWCISYGTANGQLAVALSSSQATSYLCEYEWACPAGHACTAAFGAKMLCPWGQYSLAGAKACSPCPIGESRPCSGGARVVTRSALSGLMVLFLFSFE